VKKRNTITPSQIDSLFRDDNSDNSRRPIQNKLKSAENFVLPTNLKNAFTKKNKDFEDDNWLQNAEEAIKTDRISREVDMQPANSANSITSLFRDWKFWIAIIFGAGFVSAFISIYQQTNGFSLGAGPGPEMII
jgi:hypothetical protein